MPRTSPGWLSLLLGCLLLLTGCAIDPEHFDGFNPVPGAARKDVAYSELRALRAVARDRADTAAGTSAAFAWQPCGPTDGTAAGLQCGRLTVEGASPDGARATLAVVRRPALDPAARQGVALVAGGPGAGAEPHLFALAEDPLSRRLNRTFDLVSTQARTVAELDAVRSALGERTWSLVGSGSAAALVGDYARTHPEHTRAAVVDGPGGATRTTPAAGPAAAELRVAARACSAGPAGAVDPSVDSGLMAGGTGCPTPPVLVVASARDTAGWSVDGSTAHDGTGQDGTVQDGDGGTEWGGVQLRVIQTPGEPTTEAGAGSCADAAIQSFLLTLVLPADGLCA